MTINPPKEVVQAILDRAEKLGHVMDWEEAEKLAIKITNERVQ